MLLALLCVLPFSAASADRTDVEDPNDSDGPDLLRVVATHTRIQWLGDTKVLKYLLDFDENISTGYLSEIVIELQINTDGDRMAERKVWVRSQAQGSFMAGVINPKEKMVGFADAFIYDPKPNQMVIMFPRSLLGHGVIDHRWRAVIQDKAVEVQRCPSTYPTCDRVPDSGWVRHNA